MAKRTKNVRTEFTADLVGYEVQLWEIAYALRSIILASQWVGPKTLATRVMRGSGVV